MSYYVKVCPKCKSLNNAALTYCGKCGADLPLIKIESDVAPPAPPAYAIQNNAPAHASEQAATPAAGPVECKIVDVEIKFLSMVALLVKLAIAAVPAAVIVFIFWLLAIAVITAARH